MKLVLAQECHPRAGGGGDPWLEIKVEKSLKFVQINTVATKTPKHKEEKITEYRLQNEDLRNAGGGFF